MGHKHFAQPYSPIANKAVTAAYSWVTNLIQSTLCSQPSRVSKKSNYKQITMFYVLFFCLELCNHLNLKTGVRIKLPGYFTLANNTTSSPFSQKRMGQQM